MRETEAWAQSDETILIRPGTDAALALAMMSVLIGEGLHDAEFVARHTVGFDALAAHVRPLGPEWAAPITGVPADRIAALARRYAATRPAMLLVGGSSMHKGGNGWQAARAIACLPALAGHLGMPGGGLGPRHGAASHGQALSDITEPERRPPGAYVPNQMPRVIDALIDRRVRVLLLFGTDMLSSFADAGRLATGLDRSDLVVSHDLFLNDTARRFADVVLPGTSWLEELGCKSTNTHLYLMPKVLEAPGEARPAVWILRELARRLGIDGLLPLGHRRGPARRDPRSSGDGSRHGGRPPRRGRNPRAANLARRASHPRLRDAFRQGRALLGAGRRPGTAASAGPRARAGFSSSPERSSRAARSPSSTASTITAARSRAWLASTPSRVSGSRRRMPRLAVSSTAPRSVSSTGRGSSPPGPT